MKIKDSELLDQLLLILLEKWGVDAILHRIRTLAAAVHSNAAQNSAQGTRPPRTKPTPTRLAERIELPIDSEDSRDALIALAKLYELKKFLPTIGSIRNFLTMRGVEELPPKDRSDAFRAVLKLLVILPVTELRRLAESDAHGAPTRLAPISEAIKTFGQRDRN